MRRELSAYFVSPMAYAFMTMFLLLVAAGFAVGVTRYAMTPAMIIERFGWSIRTQLISGTWGLMTWGTFAALLSLPGLSMRLLSEEKKSGTAEIAHSVLSAPKRRDQTMRPKPTEKRSTLTLHKRATQ